MKKSLLLLLCSALFFLSCNKEDDVISSANQENQISAANPGNIQTRILNSTLNFPWEILWGPDNMIWFTERLGFVKKMNPETGEVTQIAHITEVASTTDFNGLLGMVLHPDFANNPYVYVVYNYFGLEGAYLQKIVRFTFDGTTLVSPMTIVDGIIGKIGGDFIHNGSRLTIGADMKLYATTGDADLRDLPQDPNALNGKVLRVNLDGSIPSDNPFGNAVWSVGHRNAQGMAFGPTGVLYNSMHGQDIGDEINVIVSGGNYGWPKVEGFCDLDSEQVFCAANNVIEPIFDWSPTTAPSGIDYYNNTEISQWKNSLLVAFLKDKRLCVMKLDETGTMIENVKEYFVEQFGRLRDIAISPDGKVYISTDNGDNTDMIIEVTKRN
jgi:aldose sugar dehydrogenase